ncbi:MAG: Bax inhibitor-1/YccA family protein, partial [Actinomycetota bacterium]
MQTANPILSRIDRDAAQASAAPTGPGFAYDEGRTAVVSAQAPAPAATATHEAGIYAGVSLPAPPGQRVTFADVMVKSAIMFGLAVVGAFAGWILTSAAPGIGTLVVLVGCIGTIVLGLVNAFKRQVSPPLTLLYAACSGIFLGAVSYWYNQLALASD